MPKTGVKEIETDLSSLSAEALLTMNLNLNALMSLPLETVQSMAEIALAPESTINDEQKTDLLAVLDALTLNERVGQYIESLRTADIVCIVTTCCDSREVVPSHEFSITKDGESKTVIMVSVPTIGGGALSRMRIKLLVDSLIAYGVDTKKITVLVTQHGDEQEIIAATRDAITDEIACTCGARQVIRQAQSSISDSLKRKFATWVRSVKEKVGREQGPDKGLTWAPDRATLEELYGLNPTLMFKIAGIAESLHIPRRLLIRVLHRLADSNILNNADTTLAKVAEAITLKFPDDWPFMRVISALYEHNSKKLYFPEEEDQWLGDSQVLDLKTVSPEMKQREVSYQDPDYVVISFGQKAISIPPEVLLAHLAKGSANITSDNPTNWKFDNIFATNASTIDAPTLYCGLSEAFYAVSHSGQVHQGDNKHGPNFAHLKKLIIVVQDDVAAEIARDIVNDEEYREDFAPVFRLLQDFVLINLKSDEYGHLGEATVERVSL